MKFTHEIGQFLYNAANEVLKATGLPNAQVALDATKFLEETMAELAKADQAKAKAKAKEEAKTSGNTPKKK